MILQIQYGFCCNLGYFLFFVFWCTFQWFPFRTWITNLQNTCTSKTFLLFLDITVTTSFNNLCLLFLPGVINTDIAIIYSFPIYTIHFNIRINNLPEFLKSILRSLLSRVKFLVCFKYMMILTMTLACSKES